MKIKKQHIITMLCLFLLASLSAIALTISPKPIKGVHDKKGSTSDNNVKCIFHKCGDPDLIQCYLIISGSYIEELSLHMTLKEKGTVYLSAPLDVDSTSKNNKKRIINFAIQPKLLEDSYIDIYTEDYYLRIEMNTIEIISFQDMEKLNIYEK